jgi:FkbH-like protein
MFAPDNQRLTWLPRAKGFREKLLAARACEPAADSFALLTALSQYNLSYLEIVQLDRAANKIPIQAHAGFTSVRLALLGSSTLDHLLPAIRVAALRRNLSVSGYIGGYGQYRQEILDSTSPLHQFQPDTVLFSVAPRDAIASIPLMATRDHVRRVLENSIHELRTLWREVRSKLQAEVIQQTFVNTARPLFGSYDRMVAAAPIQLTKQLNDLLAEAAATDGIALLDIAAAAEQDGLDAWHDEGRWLQGKMEVAPYAAPLYGELTMRIVGAQRGLSKKCLVLDLDDTLWGGIVGEEGIEGIKLGEGSALGEAHLGLQRYAKQLKERGVILAICSKNDPQIAEHAFTHHPEMLLKREDIASFVANWQPKPDNLQRIARSLNIGLDSVVFVDDNPAERAAMREALPTVAVPELPEDPAQYVRCLAGAGYFEAIAFTDEDRERGRLYNASAELAADLKASASIDDFRAGLRMSTTFGPFRESDLPRVTQLINKTNQFNPTTRRYSLRELQQIRTDPACLTLQFRLSDRLGDNGLVSALILRRDHIAAEIYDVDTWVMSCRVFGRELEFEAMNIAVEAARHSGALSLRAKYVPSAKNAVVKDLYSSLGFLQETLGFQQYTDGAPGSDTTYWHLALDTYQMRKTHIVHKAQ